MTREIKFKAWDKERKKFYTDAFVSMDGTGLTYNGVNSLGCEDDTYELMQYTGLKDSKGVEIYEGDIIQTYQIEYPSRKKVKRDIRTITWGKVGFEFKKEGENGYVNLYDPEFIEIIGNCFENPDLIKK